MFDIVFLYLRLARLDRPIGWLLLLWPTLWAVWIAGHGAPAWPIVAVFMAGAIVTRAAGCVVNDYFDRDFDGHVERTRKRPLATGEISVRGALMFALCLGLLALALVLTLNPLAQWLAVAGAQAIYSLSPALSRTRFLMGYSYGIRSSARYRTEPGVDFVSC